MTRAMLKGSGVGVMNAASIVPEDDIQDQEPRLEIPEEPEAEERLSVFEDFLDGLGKSDPDNGDEDNDTGDHDNQGDPDPTI